MNPPPVMDLTATVGLEAIAAKDGLEGDLEDDWSCRWVQFSLMA